ncbi:Rieske 2Fe-2S domain-containing protein [Erythrobacter jejuensis]|uniref:Rieske 2Fe-2S domain-containing protein n=2 Tax=Parerythrobacter jejuensis TaxID=795812 RepID=A0A845AQ41_9SPHN|nr:Rieske 2Fe-2S domain-containing protein [Parerythrobacter jejuensis]MXP32962.1 Rieske 2Fe-2S domain-containing protein [Parerythrobacter jejuensis]
MDAQEVETLKALMEWEAGRSAPPEGFPHLPDMPAARYTSQAYFNLEQEHIFRKSWLFAAHIDEVPEPGCFMRWHNAGDPIIIVHGMDGVVRAFYNTCRHRGAPVVTEDKGRSPRLMCGYHNWTYKTDGSLIGVPERQDFPPDFDMSCRGLIPVRCEMFGNCIFVNFDEGAKSLLDWLGPLADEWAEFRFDKVRLAARHSFELNCNWKVAMEANMEVYHVPYIHPDTVAPLVDSKRNVNHFYPNGHARMLAPAPQQTDREHVRAIDSPPEWQPIETVGELGRTATQSYTLFPNWVSPLSNFFVPPLLFWPTGLGTTRLELVTMALDWGDAPAPDLWTVPDASKPNGRDMSPIILEDTQFGEAIQKSMESQGFKSVPLSYQEARIYSFHQNCDRMIGTDAIPEELRVAQVIGKEWVWPNDPRVELMRREQAPEDV